MAAAGSWPEAAAVLDGLAAGDPADDYRLCLFIHALRGRYRPDDVMRLWALVHPPMP